MNMTQDSASEPFDWPAEVRRAAGRISPYIRETPVERSELLAEYSGAAAVWLKCENMQATGSFKLRGALNRLLAMPEARRERGVIAASTGNHGLAIAHAARALDTRALVFHPRTAEPTKLEGIARLGAELVAFGDDCVECEREARRVATEREADYVSPYNDPLVAAGQGTIAYELERQLPGLDAVFVSVGGGGLVSGVGSWLRHWQPAARIFGCSPAHSAVMLHSLAAGVLLELESKPTLSDGTAGGVEAGAITFPLCQGLIDESVFVTEQEIAAALRLVVKDHHMLIEGAAATAVAAYLQQGSGLAGQRVALILCGANISLETLREHL